MPSLSLIYNFEHRLQSSPPSSTKNRRILDPICEFLVTGQFKQALKACEKAIGKAAKDNGALLRCLKGYTLVELRKADEARATLLNAAKDEGKNGLGDTDVLIFLAALLPEIGEGILVLEIADKAVKAYPDNLALFHEVMSIFVQRNELKRLQLLCMKGQKSFQDTRLKYWTLTALLLQIIELPPGNSSNNLLLSMCERYMNDQTSTKNGEWNATEFWIKAKHAELKLREARAANHTDLATSAKAFLDVFEAPEARVWIERELGFELWRRDAIRKNGTAKDISELSQQMLELLKAGDTNWHTIATLVEIATGDSQTELAPCINGGSTQSTNGELPHELVGILLEQLRTLSEDSRHGRERGYLLGQLKLVQSARKSSNTLPSLLDLALSYFSRFGNKACCFDDLLSYLQSMSGEERTVLLDKLQQGLPASTESIVKRINSERISQFIRYSVASMPLDDLCEDAKRCIEYYLDLLPLGKDLLETDLQPADDFAILATGALLQAFSKTDNVQYLLQAVSLLRFASKRSQYNYQMKFLLIRILRLLGLPAQALLVWQSLGIKQIQKDSTHHFILERASSFTLCSPIPKKADAAKDLGDAIFTEVTSDILDWYTTGIREAGEATVKAWRNCVVFKIEEYSALHRRLQTSFARHTLGTELTRTASLHGADVDLGQDLAPRTGLYEIAADNRDYSVLPDSMLRLTAMGPAVDRQSAEAMQYIRLFYDRGLSKTLTPAPIDFTQSESLTPTEQSLCLLTEQLFRLAYSSADAEAIQTALTESGRFFNGQIRQVSELLEQPTPTWRVFHVTSAMAEASLRSIESYININQAWLLLSDLCTNRGMQSKPIQQKMTKAVKDHLALLQPQIRQLVEFLKNKSFDVSAEAAMPEFSEFQLDEIIQEAVHSWYANLSNTAQRMEGIIGRIQLK